MTPQIGRAITRGYEDYAEACGYLTTGWTLDAESRRLCCTVNDLFMHVLLRRLGGDRADALRAALNRTRAIYERKDDGNGFEYTYSVEPTDPEEVLLDEWAVRLDADFADTLQRCLSVYERASGSRRTFRYARRFGRWRVEVDFTVKPDQEPIQFGSQTNWEDLLAYQTDGVFFGDLSVRLHKGGEDGETPLGEAHGMELTGATAASLRRAVRELVSEILTTNCVDRFDRRPGRAPRAPWTARTSPRPRGAVPPLHFRRWRALGLTPADRAHFPGLSIERRTLSVVCDPATGYRLEIINADESVPTVVEQLGFAPSRAVDAAGGRAVRTLEAQGYAVTTVENGTVPENYLRAVDENHAAAVRTELAALHVRPPLFE